MESRYASKQNIRNKYLSNRNSLSKEERTAKSMEIWGNLRQENNFQEADIILVYMNYRSEVMTTGLVEQLLIPGSDKRVFAPTVEGFDIAFYEITSLNDLYPGYQGIREPKSSPRKRFTTEIAKENKCFVLVPGTVFDRQLGRMGYGKGFYDRFLHSFPTLTKAGLAFSCQIARQIPTDTHDVAMDMVVTEDEVFK